MSMEPVLHSFSYCLEYLREQVADLAEADMAAQPQGISNHPAWVIGHLTHACELIGGVIGLRPWLPDDWEGRFGTGSSPVSDDRVYPSKDASLAILNDAHTRISEAVRRLDDASLDSPFPDPAYLYVFPTVRHALTQVLVGHTANHIGTISVWRRAMGLPGMSRAFE